MVRPLAHNERVQPGSRRLAERGATHSRTGTNPPAPRASSVLEWGRDDRSPVLLGERAREGHECSGRKVRLPAETHVNGLVSRKSTTRCQSEPSREKCVVSELRVHVERKVRRIDG